MFESPKIMLPMVRAPSSWIALRAKPGKAANTAAASTSTWLKSAVLSAPLAIVPPCHFALLLQAPSREEERAEDLLDAGRDLERELGELTDAVEPIA